MEVSAFDRLTRTFALIGSRRRLLAQLSALPLAGLLASVDEEETAAKRPRHGRRASHRPGKAKKNRTGKRHESNREQDECSFCSIACDPPPNTRCACQVCTAACKKQCPYCTYTTVQGALNAASPGATIHICPGTYKRPGGSDQPVADIIQSVTLRGAGQGKGAGSTILDGGVPSGAPVVNVGGGINVTLKNLTVTGADGNPGISVFPQGTTLHLQAVSVVDNRYTTPFSGLGGGILTKRSTVVLDDQTVVSGNQAVSGAGIFSLEGGVTLNPGSSVTGNRATSPYGAGISLWGGTFERNGGVISGNTPYDCRNVDGQPC